MIDPDHDLILQSRSGNKQAFGKLVEAYYDMVYAVAYGVLHNREAALDVAQDVFLKAFRELVRFEGKSKFKTWIYRIAVNAAIDEARKLRPADSLDATDASADEDKAPLIIPEHRPGAREKLHQSEMDALLHRAMEGLSPEHRAIVVLREWEDFSYGEIAEMLGLQIGTVMSRLFYARKKLAEILKVWMKKP